MIQANELRIGNWVKDRGGKLLQIDRFYGSKIECDIKGMPNEKNGIKIYYHPLTEEFEYLQPIPLTHEILEEFGFVLDKGVGVWFNVSKSRTIAIWDSHSMDYKLSMADNNHILVNSLHQLQNLYFALTGEELTFKP